MVVAVVGVVVTVVAMVTIVGKTSTPPGGSSPEPVPDSPTGSAASFFGDCAPPLIRTGDFLGDFAGSTVSAGFAGETMTAGDGTRDDFGGRPRRFFSVVVGVAAVAVVEVFGTAVAAAFPTATSVRLDLFPAAVAAIRTNSPINSARQSTGNPSANRSTKSLEKPNRG